MLLPGWPSYSVEATGYYILKYKCWCTEGRCRKRSLTLASILLSRRAYAPEMFDFAFHIGSIHQPFIFRCISTLQLRRTLYVIYFANIKVLFFRLTVYMAQVDKLTSPKSRQKKPGSRLGASQLSHVNTFPLVTRHA